jgi:hypothetical protein
MDDNETRRHQMFVRVRDFGQAHIGDFAPTSLAHQHFADLTTVIVNLDQHAAAEQSGRALRVREHKLARKLASHCGDALEAINRTARAMADDTTGIETNFGCPSLTMTNCF